MASAPLMVALLLFVAVMIGFVGMWRLLSYRDPIEERLAEYGAQGKAVTDDLTYARRRTWSRLDNLLAGFGFGPRVAAMLTQADIPLTAAEYSLIILAFILGGLLLGIWQIGLLFGIVLGVAVGFVPLLYLQYRANKRRRAFTEQIPEILTLLVGALRAGYGLTQAIDAIIDQIGPPASVEFSRVMRAINLGVPLQQALKDMADRIGSTDWDMVVTAITVQYETGGNLAQTLETIGETVRDRIRMLREIRVMTAQQRLTGYLLAILPFAVGFGMFLISPTYIMRLFEPGLIRLLPVMALIMMVLGFLVIRRIVDIDV